MIEIALLLLVLLHIKHFLVDFVFQTQDELEHKGDHLDWRGMTHSLKHGAATFLILLAVIGFYHFYIFFLALLDIVLHYYIDFIKKKYSPSDVSVARYWHFLGLDQLAHQLTYILIVTFTVL